MWQFYNPNPHGNRAIDCTVRALCKALDTDWDTAFCMIAAKAFDLGNMPSANVVWGAVLRERGFEREIIPNTCPDCYTAADFITDHPQGTYVLTFENHVATVVDGILYDTWDSTNEIPLYYFHRKDE